jgi:hypothetical protein
VGRSTIVAGRWSPPVADSCAAPSCPPYIGAGCGRRRSPTRTAARADRWRRDRHARLRRRWCCRSTFHGGLPVSAVAIVPPRASCSRLRRRRAGLGAGRGRLHRWAHRCRAAPNRPGRAVARLATFWLPVLPGWAAMLWLQRFDAI